jgi:uncharacterized membrane protein YfcA
MLSIPLSPLELVFLVAVALLICILSTSMAMESTALFVPAFVMFFPVVLPQFPSISFNEAVGLTLIIMFFGQTSANIGYWVRGQIDFSLAAGTLIWTIPLAVAGRLLSYFVPDTLLLLIFSGLLVGLAAVISRHAIRGDDQMQPKSEGTEDRSRSGNRLQIRDRLAMSLGGGVTGLVGLGMGEVSNTVLTSKGGMDVHRSIGTSTLILYLTVLSAAVTNLTVVRYGGAMGVEPSLPWIIAVVIAPVVFLGGQIGPYVNSILPERTVVRILVVLYIAVAIVTVIRALG